MDKQKDYIDVWYKVEKNSLYGNIPPSNEIIFYDEKMTINITEEDQKNLKLFQETLNKKL